MAKILPELILPLGLTLQFLIYGWLLRKRLPRLAMALRFAAITVLVFFSLPITADSLIRSVESRHATPNLEDIAAADVIVLLGGGVQLPTAPRVRAQLGAGADRLLQTHELWLAGKASHIIISSGNNRLKPELDSEASVTKKILTSWGIPDEAIVVENNSVNTEQNASQTLEILRKNAWANVLLVTSATHMPRSMALFNQSDLTITPVAADYWVPDTQTIQPADFIPRGISLGGSTKALREYLGMAFYYLKGRISLDDLKVALAIK